MSCTIKYKDQEFQTPEELLSYATEHNLADIISAFNPEEYYQESSQSTLPSDEDINKKVEEFLEKIGVSVLSVRDIKDSSGKKLSAVAKADMLNKIIEVVQDKADITTLPEEAAHFFVEMLGDNNPLLKTMLNNITGYKLYGDVVNQYKGNKAYRNEDGTINFTKIKKEAIGKLIALHVIEQERGSENEVKLTSAMNWWSKVLDFIKNIFSKSTTNPFSKIASKIRDQDTSDLEDSNIKEQGDFYQLDDSLSKLDQDQSRIQLDNSIDPVSQQKRHIYTYDGEQAKGSVTSVYVDKWLKKIFKSDNRSDQQKETDLLKAEYGDTIHDEMQNITKSWTNPDGTLRDTQTPHEIVTTKPIYDKLNQYVQDLMSLYPEGTIFKSETKIYDKKTKIAGSIDFLAIQPDGKVDVYDWKSQEIGKQQDDLKQYKTPMYRIQLENYRKILQLEYGFQDFGKVRAIPIKTEFIYNKGKIATLRDIEIGDINPSNIPDEKNYLLPVTLKNETTGSEDLDTLIEKLHGIYDKISNTRYTKDEIYKKREELAQLGNALRDLQLRNKVDRLIELGLLEFNKYNERIKNNTLSGKDIQESRKILQVFNQSGNFLYELMQDLQRAAKETEDPQALTAYNEMKDKFLSMTARTGKLISDIEKYNNKEAIKLGEQAGVEKLLDPEAPIGAINGLFASLSKITQKSFRTFSSMLRKAQNIRDSKFDTMASELHTHKANFEKYIKQKGLSVEKGIEMILNTDEKGKWTGNFLNVYKSEFYKNKESAIKTGDSKWMLENLEFDDERYKEQEAKQIDFFNSVGYSIDPLKNKALVEAKIKEWKEYNNVLTATGGINKLALMNPNNKFLRANDSWQTDKWKELNKPENKPVKDMYDYFQSMIRYSEKLGMLDKYSPGFIPSMFATKVDQLVFGDIKDIFNNNGFFDKLEVDSGSQYTPEVDPTDGTIINRIPVYFTRDMGEKQEDGTYDYTKKSRDLFKVFATWGAHMYNYEAMEHIEDTAMVLLEAEKNKKSLVVDRWNNVVIKGGKVEAVDNNDRNAKLLENVVNFYLYDKITGYGSDVKFKVPFTSKEYSLTKTVSSAIQFFGFKTLALNPISGTSQFVGGTGNALFMAKKGIFFTTNTWAKGMYMATSDKKSQAAIHWANVHLEGNKNHTIADLSLSTANRVVSKDSAYIIQRYADAAVQNPVTVAMMLSHMVVDGNIVDINQYVKDKYNYNDEFYNLSKEDRKTVQDKIDSEVRDLQENNNLIKTGTLDDHGHFTHPEINKDSDAMSNFRNKVMDVNKKILGNVSREDINGIRTTMLGMSLMQFRNWIPDMMEERLSGLKYDAGLGVYTYGKLNLFMSELFSKRFPTLAKSIVMGFGDDGIQGAKDKYNELQRKAFEQGQDFKITQGEFIDMYIGNIRSEMLELLTMMGFAMAVLSVVGGGKNPDDTDFQGVKKYANRALKKYYNEFAFYYNPIEFTSLVKSPLPVVGLAEDFFRFSFHMAKQGVGFALQNEQWEKQAQPAKYFFKMVPIANQGLSVMAAFDDDFRKEWNIKLN